MHFMLWITKNDKKEFKRHSLTKWQQTLTNLFICRSIPRDFSMSLLFLCFLSSLLMVFSCLSSLCLLLCLSRARIWAFGGLNTPLLLPIIFGWSFAVGTYWPKKNKIPLLNFQVQVKFRLVLGTTSSLYSGQDIT